MIKLDYESIKKFTADSKLSDKDKSKLDQINSILRDNPSNLDILAEKGFLLFQAHLDAEAIKTFELILKLNHKYIMAYVWLAELLLFHWADAQQAEIVLNEALKIESNRSDLYYLLANVFRVNEEEEKYKYYLKKALEYEPDWINPRICLVEILIKEKKFELANEEIQKLKKYLTNANLISPKNEMQAYYETLITGRIISPYMKNSLSKMMKIIENSLSKNI